jgi:hypothetical protein
VRVRSRAVALSISLVVAASGAGTAAAAPQAFSQGDNVAQAIAQDPGPALGDDGGSDEESSATEPST